MTVKLVLAIIQIVCVFIQIGCLISMIRSNRSIEKDLKTMNQIYGIKDEKPKHWHKFYLCQWLVLHSRKPYILVFGRRRCGKSYTARQLALREFKKGNSVAIFCKNTKTQAFMFQNMVNLIAENGITAYYNYPNEIRDKENKNFIKIFGDTNAKKVFEEDYRGMKLPQVVIADEVYDSVLFYTQLQITEGRRHHLFQKIFLTSTPYNQSHIEHAKEHLNGFKIYRWGLHCGVRLPRKFVKEYKKAIKEKQGATDTYYTKGIFDK